MSGRERMALCAYAATLLAAAALLPLVDPATWIVQAAFLLALVTGAGAIARRVPLGRMLTVALQALVALVLMTAVFTGQQAFGALIPTPSSLAGFGELLSSGAEDVARYASPAPATDGIRLMVIGGVLLIGLTVDALAVTFRMAAPAGLPLLALYSVAASLSGGSTGWLYFLLAGAGYLVLLLAEGRERLSQWGRVFGGASPARGRMSSGLDAGGGRALAPVRTGRRIGALALGVALAVPAALPALDGGLLLGPGGGSGPGIGGGGTISAVNPLVSLQDSLNQPEDREVIRYRTNAEDTRNLYLRIVALDQFDGTAWKSSERKVTDVPGRLPQPDGLSPDVRVTEVITNLSAADSYRQNWLPLPYPAMSVKIDGRWRFEPEGRTLVGDRGQTTKGAQYSVSSLIVEPTREQLIRAPRPPSAVQREYTKVPDVLPDVVSQTARDVTRGSANDYERAVKLQQWFADDGGFTYDTDVESGTGVTAISRFLKQKEGFCVHFSFSMAAMARTLGIPARVAVGFTPGSLQSDGTMSVGLRDAHAWPELYFEGVGWTRFEPTPDRGNVPEYTREQAPSGGPSTPAEPVPDSSAAPSAAPAESDRCPEHERRLGECGAAAPAEITPPSDEGFPLGTVLWVAPAVAAAVLLPLLPLLWRLRTRARRLAASGGPGLQGTPGVQGAPGPGDGAGVRLLDADGVDSARAAAGTLAAWQEIIDSAWDLGIPPDESQTPRRAAARIVRMGKLEEEPAEAVHRAASAVEQVLYAPEPRPGTGLAEDASLIRAGLLENADRWTRLRALLLPRSSVRALWSLLDRWRAVTDRWGRRMQRMRPDRRAAALRRPSRQRG
ncbi:DUF3488 and transglutaminase-like domain-containing protein [Streptomyces sp. HNM0663]|uniref:DUF3488 and transglutaminase-like domain-containing protein n=1 Tax=Streptomyces chengmaiensis TaxID=3040919 RepID=A0ABT6HY76_9ACTN|nr:DUF3488 and transglutaminase-like domain-containing protein [Streptomyces chengmaiensis]MDH2393668.1 DUF3488 and transglutaminase-like domain-containing protein [Streptomyces chengmaiensis]